MRLDEAVATNEILEAVASFEWWEVHKTKIPQEAIPKQSNLASFRTCPPHARNEANSLLTRLFTGTSGAYWYNPDENASINASILVARVVTKVTLLQEYPDGSWSVEDTEDHSVELVSLPDVHKKWLESPEDQRPEHPLGPLVRAWQLRPLLREKNKRDDPILPVMRQIKITVPIERQSGQLMLGLAGEGSEQKPMPLFPHFKNLPNQAWRVPLLALADASGTPSRSYGRGAALDLRLVVESTLSIEVDDRELPAIALVFKVKELRDALFPNNWRIRRDWPRVREALLRAHTRSIPIDERDSQWFPLAIRQLPSVNAMHLDDEIIIEAALPPGSKTGPVTSRRILRQLGVESSPRYRAYIGVHSLAWEPGITRIVNPRTNKHGWAGDPDRYPVLTLNDRRFIAFGSGDNKHRTSEEINKAFADLPDTTVIQRDALDPKTAARGWRVLPNEAANVVQNWLNARQSGLPNRGNRRK